MREIHWSEEYPEMPEYIEEELTRRISKVLEEDETEEKGNWKKKESGKVYRRKYYWRIAGVLLCSALVLLGAGTAIASMEDGSLIHLTALLFEDGRKTASNETGEIMVDAGTENVTGEEKEQQKSVESEAPEQFTLDIQKYGVELTDSYRGEGYTINLKGMITDGYTGILYYEIHMDDEEIGKKYEWWGGSRCYSEDGVLLSQTADTLLNKNGSSFNYEEFGGSGKTLYGSSVTFVIDSVMAWDINNSTIDSAPQYDCDLEITIPIKEEEESIKRNFTVKDNADFGFYGDGYIEDVTITPLGIYFNCSSYQAKANKGEFPDTTQVVFRDGTKLDLMSSAGFQEETGQGYLKYGYPVNPDDVVSFQFGDYIYNIEE